MPNVELFIFSATRHSSGIEQKQVWLDSFAPFFKRENRIILSREENNMVESSILKAEYLANYERDGSVLILIDDDPKNLKDVRRHNEDIILLKDTVLVDGNLRAKSDCMTIDDIYAEILKNKKNGQSVKGVSDGYHTIEEYVDIRNHLFVALCNSNPNISWKSKKHFDEENDPIFNVCFIAGIDTEEGSITFHLKLKFWDELEVREIDKAPKYDGYTTDTVKKRIKSLYRRGNSNEQ